MAATPIAAPAAAACYRRQDPSGARRHAGKIAVTKGVGLQLGGPVPPRGAAFRGRARHPRYRARLRPGQAAAARHRGLSRGEDRPGHLRGDGSAGPDRCHTAGEIRLRRRQLRVVRSRCPRDRARRQRLPLHEQRAVLFGDVSDLCLRLGGAAPEVSAQARLRRMGRLLRTHRAGRGLRSRLHDDAGREGRRRLPADRHQDVDLQRPDRGRVRGVGEIGRARGQDPRLRAGEGHEGAVGAQDRRQAVAALLHHRRDRHGRRCRAGGKPAAQRVRSRRPVRLSEPGALRHRLGIHGRSGRLLAPRAAVHVGPQAVRPAARRHAADAEEARRHADRDFAGATRGAARGPAVRRGQDRARR